MKNRSKLVVSMLILLASTIGMLSYAQTSVGDIGFKFCNDRDNPSNKLSLVMEANKEQEICMQFSNDTEEDVSIKYGFIDGAITNDEYKNKACKNEGEITEFGQYITGKFETTIIPAGEAIVKKASIMFPVGYKGAAHGCLTYYIQGTPKETASVKNAMFDILVRKAHFIDVIVSPGELTRSINLPDVPETNLSTNKKIEASVNESNELVLNLSVENKGVLDEKVKVMVKANNVLGWNKTIDMPEEIISSNNVKAFSVNLGKLPFYKGIFSIDVEVAGNPTIDITDATLSDSLKTPIMISQSTNIILINRYLLGYLVVGIILLLLLIRLLKHIHVKITKS